MKKLSMAFVTLLIVAGLASSALADPGWSNSRRFDDHGRNNQIKYKYEYNHRDHREPYRQTVHHAPVLASRQVVHVYRPDAPSISLFFPHMSIQIR
jgi:hypothetical protein